MYVNLVNLVNLDPDQYQGSQKLVIRILRSQVGIVFIKFIYNKKIVDGSTLAQEI